MPISRRQFFFGAGALISSAFVDRVLRHIKHTGQPFLTPPQQSRQALYYERVEDVFRLHLGIPVNEIPAAPSLLESLRLQGVRLSTPRQIDSYLASTGWSRHDLDQPIADEDWWNQWCYNYSPEALAFLLLKRSDIFIPQDNHSTLGQVIFRDSPNPISSSRWVEVVDELSLSLLQDRLTETRLMNFHSQSHTPL